MFIDNISSLWEAILVQAVFGTLFKKIMRQTPVEILHLLESNCAIFW